MIGIVMGAFRGPRQASRGKFLVQNAHHRVWISSHVAPPREFLFSKPLGSPPSAPPCPLLPAPCPSSMGVSGNQLARSMAVLGRAQRCPSSPDTRFLKARGPGADVDAPLGTMARSCGLL
jgi:hypothetical protein